MERVYLGKLNVELTAHCNIDCVFCSLKQRSVRQQMSLATVRQILDQLVDSAALRLHSLHIYQGGEMLLHPQLDGILAMLAEYRVANVMFPEVYACSNAMFMTPDITERILTAGAIDVMQFSVDGAERGEFEHIRRGASWDQVLRNIEYFIDRRDALRIPLLIRIVTTTITKTAQYRQCMDAALRRIHAKVDLVGVYPPSQLDIRLKHDFFTGRPTYTGPCILMDNALAINADGNVVPCCAYLDNRHALGRLADTPLLALYEGAARREFLHNLHTHQRRKNAICRYCNMIDNTGTPPPGHEPWLFGRDNQWHRRARCEFRLHVLARNIAATAGRGIIIFGCGQSGHEMHAWAEAAGLRIVAFIDNNPLLAGASYRGIPIHPTAWLSGQTQYPVVIAARGQPRLIAGELERRFPELPVHNLSYWLES